MSNLQKVLCTVTADLLRQTATMEKDLMAITTREQLAAKAGPCRALMELRKALDEVPFDKPFQPPQFNDSDEKLAAFKKNLSNSIWQITGRIGVLADKVKNDPNADMMALARVIQAASKTLEALKKEGADKGRASSASSPPASPTAAKASTSNPSIATAQPSLQSSSKTPAQTSPRQAQPPLTSSSSQPSSKEPSPRQAQPASTPQPSSLQSSSKTAAQPTPSQISYKDTPRPAQPAQSSSSQPQSSAKPAAQAGAAEPAPGSPGLPVYESHIGIGTEHQQKQTLLLVVELIKTLHSNVELFMNIPYKEPVVIVKEPEKPKEDPYDFSKKPTPVLKVEANSTLSGYVPFVPDMELPVTPRKKNEDNVQDDLDSMLANLAQANFDDY